MQLIKLILNDLTRKNILIIENSGDNKVQLISTLLSQNETHFEHKIIASPNSNRYELSDFDVYEEYSPDIIEELFRKLRSTRNRLEVKSLIILDNYNYNPTDDNHLLDNLMFNGTCYNITLILISQDGLLPPQYRMQFNYICNSGRLDEINQLRLYNLYGYMFPTFEEYKETLRSCCGNDTYMITDNVSYDSKAFYLE